MTVYIGPGAMGSGVAEVMGLLNGINFPDAIGFNTLFTKCLGTLFAVCGGLCIGKEGPLVHIGANVGAMCCYLPFKLFEYLQNDQNKRQMIAAGSAAGVSCAFGAPIGGALFAYEISKPNTFWTISMLWRVFFCTSISTFIVSVLQALSSGRPLSLTDSGAIKISAIEASGESSMLDLPGAIVIGIFCGLLGALFIYVTVTLGPLRKKHINTPFKKIMEVVIFGFVTASCFYGVVAWRRENCRLDSIVRGETGDNLRFTCSEGSYNPFA
jgi:H+/Cl- antiporter ClcA